MARCIGCVGLQSLELHQHFVAVVVGYEVAEGFHVAIQWGVEPVAHAAPDVGVCRCRLAAFSGDSVARLPVTHTILAEDAVHGHLETNRLQVAVPFAQRVGGLVFQCFYDLIFRVC